MREDFDYTCECGYYQCEDCSEVWYPMEMGMHDGQPDDGGPLLCPNCSGECEFKLESEA